MRQSMVWMRLNTHLGNGLGLISLFSIVRSNALGLDAFSLGVVSLIVRAKEIDFIVVLLFLNGSSSSGGGLATGAQEGFTGSAGSGEGC